MMDDIRRMHRRIDAKYFCWGARPFSDFWDEVQRQQFRLPIRNSSTKGSRQVITIGYAAAFPDVFMANHEVDLLLDLSTFLHDKLPFVIIQVRPYPTIDMEIYGRLKSRPNVVVVDIQGGNVDRFGDSREYIKFGSHVERLDFLGKCDCFLSLATSFTLEAAIVGLPIVQLYLALPDRSTEAERIIFKRFDLSDHLLRYFLADLYVVGHFNQLAEFLHCIYVNDCCSDLMPSIDSLHSRSSSLVRTIGLGVDWDMRRNLREIIDQVSLPRTLIP